MSPAVSCKEKSPAHVEVIPAAADQLPVLANLLELYAHDFSEFHEVEIGADGRFGYKDLPLYWSEPDRHPFFLQVDGSLAGFALVKRMLPDAGDEIVWDMAEFFVVRGQRRRGIGVLAAKEVWRRFPGRWQVRIMEANDAGRLYWQRAVAAFAGEEIDSTCFEKDGGRWRVFSFESRPAS
jgi:predicted acetyltransferase